MTRWRRPDNPSRRRPPQLRRRFLHRDRPTWDADSYRGLRLALHLLFRWIDLNFVLTADGWLVNLHWPRPLLHGYVDPEGKLRRGRAVFHMRKAQALRLESPAGDQVHTAEDMLARAGELRRDVELELKPAPGHDVATYARACSVVDAAAAAGVRLVVKTLVDPGGVHAAVERLTPFHRAGATTLLLTHGHAAPRSCWPVVDHVRGRVHWTGSIAEEGR